MSSTESLTIKSLFSGDEKYVIPIYQRNYAWKESHVVQLIKDIHDYAQHKVSNKYYIGTLIVFERESTSAEQQFEVIDGQQRLTTLFILLSYLNREEDLNNFKKNLTFESRDISSRTLDFLYDKADTLSNVSNKKLNVDILQANENIAKTLSALNDEDQKSFKKYLLNNVQILRVFVPKDTDLNHYFEIMNNRGEQLEKHEILKAKMLSILKENEQELYVFNLIWEACTNMENYVQYGFDTDQRKALFGDSWSTLNSKNFDDVFTKLNGFEEYSIKEIESLKISDLIKGSSTESVGVERELDNAERFTSPINFSNFLLQVLRVQLRKDIALDDKRLLETFGDITLDGEFVKKFIFNLLKSKFLTDKYILKREYLDGKDEWSLKELYNSGKTCYYKNTFDNKSNKKILLLLSMFHVSAPTLIYKHWFNAALHFLSESAEIKAGSYIDYLKGLAEAYLYDRYLAKEEKGFFEIIYTNKAKKQKIDIDENKLDKGTQVKNFIFNYLDYLLWEKKKEKARDFSFTFRSSVEHFYPQNPKDGIAKLDSKLLNSFGNLCLISRSKNSELSNHTPKAKCEYYKGREFDDSIKQGIMLETDNWDETDIEGHSSDMKTILLGSC